MQKVVFQDLQHLQIAKRKYKMCFILIFIILGTLHGSIKAETVEELQARLHALEQENNRLKTENVKLESAAAESAKKDKEIEPLEKAKDACSNPKSANVDDGLALAIYLRTHYRKLRTESGYKRLIQCTHSLSSPAMHSCVPFKEFTGIKIIALPGEKPFSVWCDSTTAGSGWLVIQNRFDGSENFARTWAEYRDGFGQLDKEFFLGLEHIYKLTNYQRFELFVEAVAYNGKVDWARYDDFLIGNEDESYMLKRVGSYAGTADVLSRNVYSKFSTFDMESNPNNYSHVYHGGYWYIINSLQSSNLNGEYLRSPTHSKYGMHWATGESEKAVKMMIRPQFA